MNQTIKDFKEAVVQATKETTKGYDTSAQIVRVEGNTAWVHIPGGVDETPVKLTVNANEGDTVQVRVSGGSAWITGNATSPPTDDARAIKADNTAINAQIAADSAMVNAETARIAADNAVAEAGRAKDAADRAETSATNAQTSATNAQTSANEAKAQAQNASDYASRALGGLSTVQSVAETLTWITQHGTMALTTDTALDPTHVYFVRDNNGDYQVGSYKYSIVVEPDVDDIATYYELTIDESLNNYVGTHLALTTEGLWLLPATSGTNKVLIATGAGSTYTIAGTYLIDASGGTVASFRADGATMSANGVQIAHLGYGAGTDSGGGWSNAPFYTFGVRTGNIGNYSVSEGLSTTASAYVSHAEGYETTASNHYSHAEGRGTTASGGVSHAEGGNAIASGDVSHAEGGETTASDQFSHAEGYGTTASAPNSHAEGDETTASGNSSHSEGFGTLASGNFSHAQNNNTIASSDNQTALGKYNVEDNAGTYAVIVGNGANANNRANIMTVDWNGNVNIASGSKYKINGTNLAASDVGAVPTTRKVNNKALSSDITLSASDVSALPITGGTVTGSLAIDNHSSAIGTVKQAYAAAKSVSNNANTNLASISLEAGTWVITGGVRFPNNATGYRRMNIGTSSGSSWADVQLPAVNGASTQLSYTVIVTTTSTKTYYLNCYHNAGTSLNLVAGGSENGINFIRAVRIA